MSTLDQIIKLLPQLTQSELDQLSTRIKSLSSLGGNTNESPNAVMQHESNPDEIFILGIISQTMSKLGADLSTVSMLQRGKDIAAFREKLPVLKKYLDRAGPERQLHVAIIQIGVEMLHDEMCDMGVTVTSRVIMRQIHRMPAAIDRQFPGYARSGMLRMILRRN